MPARWPISGQLKRWVAARTEFFDSATAHAIERGVRQIVIVAAGYDCRAQRFRTPGVRFFELDHPMTQQDKLRRMRALHIHDDAVAYAACDLTGAELPAALAGAGHDRSQQSLFVCEGLLLYLPVETGERLLSEMRSRASAESVLTLSASERIGDPPALARVRRAGQQALMTAIGERRRSLPPGGQTASICERAGWHVRETRSAPATWSWAQGLLLSATPSA